MEEELRALRARKREAQQRVDAEYREKVKEAARNVIDFVHRNGIKTIVAVGPSAVYSARFLLKAIRKASPGREAPELHSLGRIEDYFKWGPFFVHERQKLSDAATAIITGRPRLLARLDEPVLLFDEHADTGATLDGAKKVFEKHLGAKRVFTGALHYAPRFVFRARPDVVGMKLFVDMRSSKAVREALQPSRGWLEEKVFGKDRAKHMRKARQIRAFWDSLLKEM